MGRNYSFTAKITRPATGRSETVTGTASSNDNYTADRVKSQVESRLFHPDLTVDVTVTERKSNRQQIAEARAARNGR